MSLNARLEPVLYLFAGLLGVAGVALAALAAHGGGEANLAASASAMCLAHAPALLALALGSARLGTAWLAGFLMIVGTLLFAGDLVTLRFTGSGLFPYAAPTGGWAMMLGWLAVAAGAVFRVRA
ncbi:DUF423 domain-containing protein [Rhizobium leguminosarum]|jgi:uncharacterized membrane protein YgdD (TMEM256/DUF423 family)|uniref:DUF423 domain-containing protein n=1 Tax=Rhizobium leguminosarum TaxID=384 RepID=A0A444HJA3_RHILE|nr:MULTISPECIES: DUF423 domain-containing protein [Rhizobium]MBY5454896.1 DUF423 domain-containing protein [Rhizobium leguminosarum]NKL07676.1 DUF423 domain-containing protein [Rhizobium leguminosarum bv. viciae]NKL85260.1 DUF423 domain-containing protein [Rhizobium leguminosarum bv. viciae]NKL94930.1 DUF423 domain-containing protein [Rhizobium leguminosarum bv. viciae]NKM95520.1 DUF423 domain-containing protein [Rhizobium leguminosarum bv. viciae]